MVSSTIIGGGAGCSCPASGLVAAGSRRYTWNTGWDLMEAERFNLYAWLEIFYLILNRLNL